MVMSSLQRADCSLKDMSAADMDIDLTRIETDHQFDKNYNKDNGQNLYFPPNVAKLITKSFWKSLDDRFHSLEHHLSTLDDT